LVGGVIIEDINAAVQHRGARITLAEAHVPQGGRFAVAPLAGNGDRPGEYPISLRSAKSPPVTRQVGRTAGPRHKFAQGDGRFPLNLEIATGSIHARLALLERLQGMVAGAKNQEESQRGQTAQGERGVDKRALRTTRFRQVLR
jgi:hypothetical protein